MYHWLLLPPTLALLPPEGSLLQAAPPWNWRITVQLPCFPPPEGPGLPWVLVAGILR